MKTVVGAQLHSPPSLLSLSLLSFSLAVARLEPLRVCAALPPRCCCCCGHRREGRKSVVAATRKEPERLLKKAFFLCSGSCRSTRLERAKMNDTAAPRPWPLFKVRRRSIWKSDSLFFLSSLVRTRAKATMFRRAVTQLAAASVRGSVAGASSSVCSSSGSSSSGSVGGGIVSLARSFASAAASSSSSAPAAASAVLSR